MTIVFHQAIFCNSEENTENYLLIKKSYESTVVPRIGESVYNYVWNDYVETKVVDVFYDMDNQSCDVYFEKRITELNKDDFAKLAASHGWKIIGR